MNRYFVLLIFILMSHFSLAQSWPTPLSEAKPGTRWWWLGSAVDYENLQWNLKQYANHGIATVEITPIYGVQGNQENNINYLSNQWMEMLNYTTKQAYLNGIEVDMATGTGWPFGGPWVPLKESACKAVFVVKEFNGDEVNNLDLTVPAKERDNCYLDCVMLYNGNQAFDVTDNVVDNKLSWNNAQTKKSNIDLKESTTKKVIALYIKYGVMKVKRAAPGGEGLVIDHFDRKAVANYLKHIEAAFERTKTPYPHTFFNDSYEVEAATWTPTLLKEFELRRGYKLQDHFPELMAFDANVLSDYRETLGNLLLENFTQQWTEWAHSHGAITRNQAHGSPANLIDCYAAVDIPEIEGFGLSDLGIKGLRRDPGKTRKNDSDFSMLKYASSAAHITGKQFTSSETFTWLTEHFRTSLSQLKPDIDLMFCAGVNHMFFHGTCYSPKSDVWPGWKFYASIDMSPTNSIWRDAPFFMEYVERCQSFLQWGLPDNDFLVYLPVRDLWRKNTGKLLMQFSIHAMGNLAPEFIKTILDIDRMGFDCDFISEHYLLSTSFIDGMLQTAAGTRYKGLIIPTNCVLSDTLRKHLSNLKSKGAHIIDDTDNNAMMEAACPEQLRTDLGIKTIRRKNSNGYHYFIANLTSNDICQKIKLAVPFKDAKWFNPLNGDIKDAIINQDSIEIRLRSGESMILQTFNQEIRNNQISTTKDIKHHPIRINGPWRLSFIEESPKVDKDYTLPQLQSWEMLDEKTQVVMGTGVYTTTFNMSKNDAPKGKWLIDLGDVRESARVYINDTFIGCAWSVPFILETKGALKEGDNHLRIEVTNLPANRIKDLDRKGVKWRKMEEINVVDINYKKTTYDQWELMPSGLNSEVKIVWK